VASSSDWLYKLSAKVFLRKDIKRRVVKEGSDTKKGRMILISK
jgi:hypothetical protein